MRGAAIAAAFAVLVRVGSLLADLGRALQPDATAGQVGPATAGISCLLVGLLLGCCCGLGWGLLLGSTALGATAAGRAVARLAAKAAASAAAGAAPHPGYALRARRRA